MKRCLWFVSLLLCMLQTAAQTNSFFPSAEGERKDYAISIQFKALSFTGVCIMKQCDGLLTGAIVNEFGIKAMDFTVTGGKKVKLLNVIPMLDKWYIRKIVKADFKYIFAHAGSAKGASSKKREMKVCDDSIEMHNAKYAITYLFKYLAVETLKEENNETAE